MDFVRALPSPLPPTEHETGFYRGVITAVTVNGSTPYPLLEVLGHLCDATEHAARAHDCDHDGWEVWREAADAGRECIRELLELASRGER